jgi:RNA polymerase sigma-70 factor (ECF subfamily)
MTRNKLANHAKGLRAARRDFRRDKSPGDPHGGDQTSDVGRIEGLAGSGPTPSRVVAARELLEEARRRFSPDEFLLLKRREQGHEWAEIATELGSSPEAIRKRLTRAIDRVAHELELDQSTA